MVVVASKRDSAVRGTKGDRGGSGSWNLYDPSRGQVGLGSWLSLRSSRLGVEDKNDTDQEEKWESLSMEVYFVRARSSETIRVTRIAIKKNVG
jgi:hypothetical protein